MSQWSLNPVFGSFWLVAASAVALLALAWLRPTHGKVTTPRRLILVSLRGLVVLLVVLAMLRPTVVRTIKKLQTSVLLVLFDQSRSMTLPGSAASSSRWQAQAATLERALAEVADAGPEFEVKVYGYDSELHAVERTAGVAKLPPQPTGEQTDLGSPLYEAVRRELGKRVAGAVVMGDGTQTAFAPQVEVAAAGRELARLGCPLFTVAFGPAGDAAVARDLAIDSLPEQYSVFAKNELVIRGVLRVRGYVNQAVPVELTIEDAAGAKRSLGVVRLAAREDGQQVPVEFPITPNEPGRFKLTMKAAHQTGELVTRNNELSSYLTVLEGGLRTLYLYGDLLGEQRLLRRTLDRSPDIQLDDVFVDPKNRSQWPVDLGQFLQGPPVDATLIENVDAVALSPETQQTLVKNVELGHGLMMIGGFSSFGAGGYAGQPLAELLPITMERFERQDLGLDQSLIRELHWWDDLVMTPTRPHPVTRLVPEADNVARWQSLPPLKGANRFRGLKPRAQVLCESLDGKPLLVAGDYGQGRVLAFAGNTSGRWTQLGRQEDYRRFWRQVVLWLAKRDDVERHDVWVQLSHRRVPIKGRLQWTAGARAASGEVIRDATFSAELVLPNGTRRPVPLSTSGQEVSGALDADLPPADYRVEVKAVANGQALGVGQANFQVLDRDVELGNPAADYDLLSRLAAQTKDAGGRLVSPEELPALIRQLRERRQESEVEVQTSWQLGDTAIDAWLFLLGLVSVLSAEWGLRKKWGLV